MYADWVSTQESIREFCKNTKEIREKLKSKTGVEKNEIDIGLKRLNEVLDMSMKTEFALNIGDLKEEFVQRLKSMNGFYSGSAFYINDTRITIVENIGGEFVDINKNVMRQTESVIRGEMSALIAGIRYAIIAMMRLSTNYSRESYYCMRSVCELVASCVYMYLNSNQESTEFTSAIDALTVTYPYVVISVSDMRKYADDVRTGVISMEEFKKSIREFVHDVEKRFKRHHMAEHEKKMREQSERWARDDEKEAKRKEDAEARAEERRRAAEARKKEEEEARAEARRKAEEARGKEETRGKEEARTERARGTGSSVPILQKDSSGYNVKYDPLSVDESDLAKMAKTFGKFKITENNNRGFSDEKKVDAALRFFGVRNIDGDSDNHTRYKKARSRYRKLSLALHSDKGDASGPKMDVLYMAKPFLDVLEKNLALTGNIE